MNKYSKGYMQLKREQKMAQFKAFLAIFVISLLFGASLTHFANSEPKNGNSEASTNKELQMDGVFMDSGDLYDSKTGVKISDITFYA